MNDLEQKFGCHQSVKDKNFESNSQHKRYQKNVDKGCHQSVKDKNFESNSQPNSVSYVGLVVVISLSKIKISKAIHNRGIFLQLASGVVISLSKIKISKAIHN